jgi:nitronate monooxygenase
MSDRLATRLTRRYGLALPVVLAPMALAAGGALAGACARGGALGLVGGGYGDLDWTRREYTLATQLAGLGALGCGFITWKLDQDASALDWLLDQPADQRPRAVMLSFGDPRPYAARIARAGVDLICQVQQLAQLPQAIEAGATVVVAQGAEAGGHGMNALNGRATLSFVPEVADWLAAQAPDTLLLAAGGIADGRTLAAALMLGADGALVGSRLWATQESLAAEGAKRQAIQTNGDGTARSSIFDILRRKNWPEPYDFRAIRNDLHRRLEPQLDSLRAHPEAARAEYEAAVAAGDYSAAHATVGEAVGLINDAPAAQAVLQRMADQARERLG